MIPPECVQSIWEQGRLWARFQHVVSEFDSLGFGHLPVTSVFTGVVLSGNLFLEQPGARIQSFLTNATGAYGNRFAFTINYYPFWDPSAWMDAGKTDHCSDSVTWATSFEVNGSVPGSLRVTRSKMRQLTGTDSNRLWIGETGWSEPVPEGFKTPMAHCPEWTSKETFRRSYGGFLDWDLSIGDGVRPPDPVFYFSMRDSWNFGKREGFGLIEGCNALTCKVRSEGYNPITFEYVAHAPSDHFCDDGLLSEFYPDPSERGQDDCEARCLVDPACQYFSYWESNWCRLTSSCESLAQDPGKAIRSFRKRGEASGVHWVRVRLPQEEALICISVSTPAPVPTPPPTPEPSPQSTSSPVSTPVPSFVPTTSPVRTTVSYVSATDSPPRAWSAGPGTHSAPTDGATSTGAGTHQAPSVLTPDDGIVGNPSSPQKPTSPGSHSAPVEMLALGYGLFRPWPSDASSGWATSSAPVSRLENHRHDTRHRALSQRRLRGTHLSV
jgi:hypothetical protein